MSWCVTTMLLSSSSAAAAHDLKEEENSFISPEFIRYSELRNVIHNQASGNVYKSLVRTSLGYNGWLAVSGIPELSELRLKVFKEMSECITHAPLKLTLQDGTTRSTWAARSNNDMMVSSLCKNSFQESAKKIRQLIDQVSNDFAKFLDKVVLNPQDPLEPLLLNANPSANDSFMTFSSIVSSGVHLDHFHVYDSTSRDEDDNDDAPPPSLDLHTDAGLFIGLVPGMFMNTKNTNHDDTEITMNSGFFIERGNGEVLQVRMPNDGNIILFMLGDGITWLNSMKTTPLRPTPHALHLPSGIRRAWFGRMFFPPKDGFLTKMNMAFSDFQAKYLTKSSSEENLEQDPIFGCSTNNGVSTQEIIRRRDLSGGSCNQSSEIFCWMQCMKIAGLNCNPNQIQCINSFNGHLWNPEQLHCTSCKPTCTSVTTTNSSNDQPTDLNNSNQFCDPSYPVSMYMNGFTTTNDASTACLVYLFPSFVLDTRTKFAFAALGTLFVGVFVEFMVLARRRFRKTSSAKLFKSFSARNQSRIQFALGVFLFFIQVVFAYFAMLLAMTYSWTIFFMVLCGLTLGHAVFNLKDPETNANVEACCATDDDAGTKNGNEHQSLEQEECSKNSPPPESLDSVNTESKMAEHDCCKPNPTTTSSDKKNKIKEETELQTV